MNKAVMTTRLSYTASEVAGQLVFCVISFYLLKFYTDIYGISAAAAGSILLFARCLDAIDAPIWGIIFGKTRSRWGKSRPWFLWLCAPFAIFGVLTFVTPSLGPTGKIAWAASTYVVCSILYTGINTPVTSILSALTPDSRERVVLTSFRMFGSKAGVLFVNLTLFKLVAWLGHGSSQDNARRGFMLVMPLYACGSIALYLLAFRNLRETVVDTHTSLTIRESFRALKGNGPWFVIFLSSLFFWIAFIARISSAPYFFEYVLHRPDLTGFANSLDVASLASILFMPYFCTRTSKRNVWAAGLIGSVIGQLIIFTGLGSLSVDHRAHRLDHRHSLERRSHGHAVLHPLRLRRLRRMEKRHPRRRPAHRHRRSLLPQGRQRPRRRVARVDSRPLPLRPQRRAIRRLPARHRA